MLYVYLSHSNRQVILPTAEKVGPEPSDGPLVSFLDGADNVIAVFLRADVALFSRRNLGQALEEMQDAPKTPESC